MRRAKQYSSIRAEVCDFNSQVLLTHSFHRYRLPPITESIFLYPTEDVHSQFTFPTSYYSYSNACIRYCYYLLSHYCHRSLSCGSVDAMSLFCCICDDASLSLAERSASSNQLKGHYNDRHLLYLSRWLNLPKCVRGSEFFPLNG
jgi:hypothetical protein